ncbi:Uncharacterised protein [Bordetella pertussis]|nr:Uncharacterised protein [Bordetella pertussis]
MRCSSLYSFWRSAGSTLRAACCHSASALGLW